MPLATACLKGLSVMAASNSVSGNESMAETDLHAIGHGLLELLQRDGGSCPVAIVDGLVRREGNGAAVRPVRELCIALLELLIALQLLLLSLCRCLVQL